MIQFMGGVWGMNRIEMTNLKVRSNKTKRTFTLRMYENGICFSKYRTLRFSKDDFEDMECNTENDWKHFLNTEYHYYLVN